MERRKPAEQGLDFNRVELPKIGSRYNVVFNHKGVATLRIQGKQVFRVRSIREWKPRPGQNFSVELTACTNSGDRQNFFGEWECVPAGEGYPKERDYTASPEKPNI